MKAKIQRRLAMVVLILISSCAQNNTRCTHDYSKESYVCKEYSYQILGKLSTTNLQTWPYDKSVITDSILNEIKNEIRKINDKCKAEKDSIKEKVSTWIKSENDTSSRNQYKGILFKIENERFIAMSEYIMIELNGKAYQLMKSQIVGNEFCSNKVMYVNMTEIERDISRYARLCRNDMVIYENFIDSYQRVWDNDLAMSIPKSSWEPQYIHVYENAIEIENKKNQSNNKIKL